jgi:hypothetical protein
MPKTHFPRVGGNQWTDSFYNPPFSVGNVFYVSSVTGTNAAGYGRSPEAPLASLAYFMLQDFPTASNGDVVYLMPGHAETVSAAAGIIMDIAGVTVIGIGTGTLQPKITFDTIISADLDIDAANTVFENVHFSANFADITAAIDVNAQFCTIRKCRFSETAVNMNALIWILGGSTTTSSGLVVEDCIVNDADAANTHFVSLPGTDVGDIIRNNLLYGDWGTAAIGAAGNVVNIQIHGNRIYNAATDVDSCINVATAGTGYISENYVTSGAAQANGITAPGCGKCQNFQGVNAEDLSALLDPVLT